MAAKAETAITNAIIKWICANDGDAWHVHGSMFQRKGEPDIEGFIHWGGAFRHLKLEVKTATGKPDPLQIYRLKVYSRAGYVAGIVRSVEQTQLLLGLHTQWLNSPRRLAPDFCSYMETRYEDHFGIYSAETGGL